MLIKPSTWLSGEQTAGLSHTMNVDNSSIESVEVFKYLGTTLTNQNSIQKEIKRRLKLGNACFQSVQNLLSSCLLSKNLKIEIYIELYFTCLIYINTTICEHKKAKQDRLCTYHCRSDYLNIVDFENNKYYIF